ncbi:MAG: biotin transporter BioY [Saccharofermentans sp.]|nr:biotin transporter BioY [Saccharofermentans sp.]
MENTVNISRIKTYDLVLAAICAALITITSWISINVWEIPFTLQTFGILLVLFSIGGKRGTVSIAVYILLGLIGAPVFAGFKSGPASLVGPTGGFIIGFLVAALVYWLVDEKVFKKLKSSPSKHMIFCAIEGIIVELVLYVFGVAWFMIMYTRKSGPIGLGAVLMMCVVPFLLPDAVKLICACASSIRTSRAIK